MSLRGSDDGGIGTGSSSGDTKKFVDAPVSSAAESGVTVDEACVSDVVNKLSEADLAFAMGNLGGLVDGSIDMSTLDTSEEGSATLETTFDCVAGS